MIAALRAAVVAGLAMTGLAAASEPTYKIVEFADLDGWERDDHTAAFRVFLNTCPDLDAPDWRAICAAAPSFGDPKKFFELLFRPVLIEDGEPMMFTGYFEPELEGSRIPTARYRFPVYALPPEVKLGEQYLSRAEIETTGALVGRGLEIAWVDDPVELFFLQIQGSGRIRLPDGSTIRVGYAGKNGHVYRSVGAEMVRRGIYQAHQVSAQVIRNWVRRNPVEGQALLHHNPSYVFFRKLAKMDPKDGPLGAMNRSITAGRSIAVDPRFTPLGAPVWIEKDGAGPQRRLMVAQDTGSAIKGAQRADIFVGTGDAAGRAAGKLRDPGRMYVLLPIQRAYSLLPEAVM
ncbi:murein transglycosylase A [Cognatishimia sp. SS12]|uniref:murein transglycosylase A n=1 Tax=Cognatishimia sp. SS12 TaxID=2979465 RepID=UPI00232ACFA6|nr:murein transglycosylase A [Cognatishimia sp. SS12]MDC0737749.1 murein transglycosylase A [Cognatishimia sp. SS12]